MTEKNVETMLGYFAQVRKVYASELNLRFKEENFSPNEISVLIVLHNNPSINTHSRLRMVLGVSKALVSRSMDSLVKRGLIYCEMDETDKRVQRIRISPEAEPFMQRLKREIEEINEELLADISPEEIDQMEKTMRKIISRFQQKEAEINEG